MSYEFIHEDVPSFRKRAGDHFLQGSNNALIVLGTDRPGAHGSGYGRIDALDHGRGAGTVHLVVGRSSDDVSLLDDRATVYVSSRTDVDDNFGVSVEGNSRTVSTVAMRADTVRASARQDLKLVISDDQYFFIDGQRAVVEGRRLMFGRNAQDSMVLGTTADRDVMVPTVNAARALGAAVQSAVAPAAAAVGTGTAVDSAAAGSVVALAAAVSSFASALAQAVSAWPGSLSNKSFVE